MAKKRKPIVKEVPLLKLDFGCGKNPREGFAGVDILDFGQEYKVDLRQPWPFADNSVSEAHSSHFVEHLTAAERIHFANELFRVLVPGGSVQIIVPYWCSPRAYGDLTHQWPPVTEWWPPYLNKAWRDVNAPHNVSYTCDFDSDNPAYTLRQDLANRPQEFVIYAMANYKDAMQDLIITLKKRKENG